VQFNGLPSVANDIASHRAARRLGGDSSPRMIAFQALLDF